MMMLHHYSKDHPIIGYFISSEQVDEGGVGGEKVLVLLLYVATIALNILLQILLLQCPFTQLFLA